MKKTSLLFSAGILFFCLMGAYTGYLYWQGMSFETELNKVEKELSGYESNLSKYQNLQVLEAINAKKALSSLEEGTIKWSTIIKDIRQTIPKRSSGLGLVDILSYSGSSNSDISMNVKTYSSSEEPYFDVADLIQAFDESDSFVGSFVPSISSGIDQEGNEILTFLINTKYVGDETLFPLGTEEGNPVVR